MIMRVAFGELASVIPVRLHADDPMRSGFGEVWQIGGGDVPVYDGTYTVTPDTVQQVLPTAQKKMVSDVTVLKIPYYTVSNTAGGETVTIGRMV